ncbi:MAG: pilus assembly protein TadG-related protein [Terracidiphilus sp.]
MKHNVSFFRRLLKDTRGQSAIMLTVSMLAFIGIAGVATDLGHAYSALQLLQSSTNSAALAGAGSMPNLTTAASQVTLYSAMPGDKNAIPSLQNVTVTPTFYCASSLTSGFGLGCAAVSGYANGVNAVKVQQTAQVPLWFGGMFHVPAFNISATATASMSGGQNTPWNVAIILDATQSMTTSDGGLQCNGTRESCALLGVQDMLGFMFPCLPGQTCTSTTGVTPVDTVSLFVFPPVLTSQAKDYYGGSTTTCPTSIPTIEPYEFQNVTTGTVTNGLLDLPVTSTYQVVPTPLGTTGNTIAAFAYDYKVNDAAGSTLYTGSGSVAGSETAVAAGAKSGCTGIQAKGGEGTYYAQAIYMAQEALKQQKTLNTASQNTMIILGDGDMSASSGLKSDSGTLNGTGSGSNKNSYAYPSAKGQCGQAILAAQNAATNGTRVYTVGYGIASGGCSTDATYSAYPGITACKAMKDMASSLDYFYSDEASGGTCPSTNEVNFTQLKQIFQAIARGLTTPRLIPNGTT